MMPNSLARRDCLKAMAAGCGGVLGYPASAISNDSGFVQLSKEHERAVNRRRWIVVQYDCHGQIGFDFDKWIDYRFSYADQPGTQIDALWWDLGRLGNWDLGRLGNVVYPSKLLNSFDSHAGFKRWREQGIDMVGRLVEETKRRNLECSWHHRVSEVDLRRDGKGAAWTDVPDPLKQTHPDWTLKCWWPHGLWDFSVPDVRQLTVDSLREVAERYDFDGIQLDFARHVPCLSLGRQWEFRHHVTDLVRRVRQMLLEVESKRGRPFLLAAKIPRNLKGCHIDGFDVEVWAAENLVDIFTLGSRSMDVDIAAFRRIAAGRNIKLQPCFDDHHTTDGYRYAPIEVLRGVFGNWWQQGADSVCTFNWSNAPPDAQRQFGDNYLPGPNAHEQAYQEVGSTDTLQFRDKVFPIERRGGYPWAEGYFNRNDDAPLPAKLARDGQPVELLLRISDDLRECAGRVKSVVLRGVLFGANDDEMLEASLNGESLPLLIRDPNWKDAQIFSPGAQPASGGSGQYKVNPRQQLLRLEFAIEPRVCQQGENRMRIRLNRPPEDTRAGQVVLEKLEVHVRFVEAP
jgi:hypothetical protein